MSAQEAWHVAHENEVAANENVLAAHNVEAVGKEVKAAANGTKEVKDAAVLENVETNCVVPLPHDDKRKKAHVTVVTANEAMHEVKGASAVNDEAEVEIVAKLHAAIGPHEANVVAVLGIKVVCETRAARNQKGKHTYLAPMANFHVGKQSCIIQDDSIISSSLSRKNG